MVADNDRVRYFYVRCLGVAQELRRGWHIFFTHLQWSFTPVDPINTWLYWLLEPFRINGLSAVEIFSPKNVQRLRRCSAFRVVKSEVVKVLSGMFYNGKTITQWLSVYPPDNFACDNIHTETISGSGSYFRSVRTLWKRIGSIQYKIYISEGKSKQLDGWQLSGRIATRAARRALPSRQYGLWVCGPAGMRGPEQ